MNTSYLVDSNFVIVIVAFLIYFGIDFIIFDTEVSKVEALREG